MTLPSAPDYSATSAPLHTDSEAPHPQRLRVGFILESVTQPRWVARTIDYLASLAFVEIALVIRCEGREASATEDSVPASHRESDVADGEHLLYRLYKKLDAHRASAAPNSLALTSIQEQIAPYSILHCDSPADADADDIDDSTLNTIRRHQLDVALCLNMQSVGGWGLHIARYGTWSYFHGDQVRYRGGPAGFWEVMEGSPVTGSTLAILGEDEKHEIIYRAYSRTNKLSVHTTTERTWAKSAHFVERKLRELHDVGPQALQTSREQIAPDPECRARSAPTNLEMMEFLAKQGGRRVRNRFQQLLSFDQWILGYQLHENLSRTASPFPDVSQGAFKQIIPPKDRFWADPFAVFQGGRYFIFCEEYPYDRGRGHISVMEMDREGNSGAPVPILEKEYHLSYPFIFQWKGEHYMIPETENNKTIELYRCTAFPYEWEMVDVLLDSVSAVDATLIEIGDRWWMFTNIAPESTRDWDAELHLFHAPSPFGPWQPHRRNPIKSDVRSARPAGALFYRNGQLHRPAQDCAERYGHALTIHQVEAINTQEYRETPVFRLPPEWFRHLVGTHTINSAPGLTLVDGLLRRSRLL